MKRVIHTIIMILCLAVGVFGVAFGLYNIVKAQADYKVSEDTYNGLADIASVAKVEQEIGITDAKPSEGEEEQEEGVKYFDIDFAALKEVNEDIVAWIIIEDTCVNYPVLMSEDNADYIRTTPEGKWATAGSIFLDCASTEDSINYIIYGHNMKDGSMFGVLKEYRDEAFYNEHPYIYILSENEQVRYQILSVHETRFDSQNYYSSFTENGYKEFLMNEKEQSLYPTFTQVDTSKKVITLSTCINGNRSTRLVLTLQEG